jgi:hypothetical protein
MVIEQFSFPKVSTSELRTFRFRTFVIAVIFALLPFTISFVWHKFDTGESGVDTSLVGVPDLAFAGVAFAIAVFSNTIFSFVKLSGWRQTGHLTFLFLTFTAISAAICFILYVKASNVATAGNMVSLFRYAIWSSASTLINSVIAQCTFIWDELSFARIELNRIK